MIWSLAGSDPQNRKNMLVTYTSFQQHHRDFHNTSVVGLWSKAPSLDQPSISISFLICSSPSCDITAGFFINGMSLSSSDISEVSMNLGAAYWRIG